MSDLCEKCRKIIDKHFGRGEAPLQDWVHCHHPRKVKREAWVCILWSPYKDYVSSSISYPSEIEAFSAGKTRGDRFIKAIKVHEWEEPSPEK